MQGPDTDDIDINLEPETHHQLKCKEQVPETPSWILENNF